MISLNLARPKSHALENCHSTGYAGYTQGTSFQGTCLGVRVRIWGYMSCDMRTIQSF